MTDEEQTRTLRNYACLLHSTYFSVVRESRDTEGLFGSLEQLIKGISIGSDKYITSLTERDVEAIKAILEKTGIYQDIEVTETSKWIQHQSRKMPIRRRRRRRTQTAKTRRYTMYSRLLHSKVSSPEEPRQKSIHPPPRIR